MKVSEATGSVFRLRPVPLFYALLVILALGCGSKGGDSAASGGAGATAAATPDTTAPTVSSVTPANSATGITTAPSVSVTFSEAMNVTSVNGGFAVKATNCSGATVSTGTPTTSDNITFTYAVTGLATSTVYATCVTTAATDAAANALASAYSATWTTSAAPDVTPPTVSSTTPTNSATGISLTPSVSVTFSEAMNVTSVNGGFAVKTTNCSGATVSTGTPTASGGNTIFTYSVTGLSNSTVYAICVTTGATDVAGNGLASAFSATFTTVGDTTPPTISSASPANSATGISTTPSVSVTFSEAMNVASVNGAFTVKATNCSGATVSTGTPTASGGNTIFTYSVTGLSGTTVYATCVTTAATDVASNALASAYSATWTTAASAAWTHSLSLDVVAASGTSAPYGMAMDSSGNVYVHVSTKIYRYTSAGVLDTTYGDATNRAAPASGPTLLTAGTTAAAGGGALSFAVDSSKQVYALGTTAGTIVQIPANGAAYTQIISGLTTPKAVAVNAAGTKLWVTTTGATTGVSRYENCAGTWVISDGTSCTSVWATAGILTNASLNTNTRGIAVDVDDILYVAVGSTTKKIYKIPANASAVNLVIDCSVGTATGSCTWVTVEGVSSPRIFTAASPTAASSEVRIYSNSGTLLNSFSNGAPSGTIIPITTTGTRNCTNTSGTAVLTGLSVATGDLKIGLAVTGTGIPGSTTILSIDSASQITLSATTTAAVTSFSVPLLSATGIAVSSDGNTFWFANSYTDNTNEIQKMLFQ